MPRQKEPPHKVKPLSKNHLLKNLIAKNILIEIQNLRILILKTVEGREIGVDKNLYFSYICETN